MEQNQTPNPGTAGEANGPAAGPRHGWDEIRDVRRLSRPHHDRMVAGVASGVARHLDVDPLLVRIGFAVLAFFGGAGIFLYAALWLVLPDDASGRAPVSLDRRSLQVAVVGIVALAAVVLLGGTWGGWPFPWQLFLVVGLVLFVMSRRNGRSDNQQWQPSSGQPGTWQPAPYPQEAPMSTPTDPAAGPGIPRDVDETAPLYGTPLFPAAPAARATSFAPTTSLAPSAPAHPYDQQPVDPTVSATLPPGGRAAVPPTVQQNWQRPPSAYPNGAVASYGAWSPQPPRVKVRRPRDPRKRGPILFWITLAVIALGIGILGMADVAGVDVPESAYPALALGVTAAMLILGAFWGRAGGLIALGLVAALATGSTMVSERWQSEDVRLTPTTASQTVGTHNFHTGTFVLDLTRVEDLSALDGQEIRVEGGAGRLEVILPEDLNPEIFAEVGVGNLLLFNSEEGQQGEGIGLSHGYGPEYGREGIPQVRLVLELGVGELVVSRQDEPTPDDALEGSAESTPSPAALASPRTEGASR